MELFQSRKLLIIKGQFFRSVLNNTTPYNLCGENSVHCCAENCKSRYEFISSPPPPSEVLSHHTHKLSTFLTGTITLISVTFFLVCAYALYSKYQSNRIRRANLSPIPNPNPSGDDDDDDEDRGAVEHHVWYIRTVGIDPAAIASITAVKYRKDESLLESTDCSVCLSEFEEGEALRLLPKCSHAFHVACIDTWLRSHTNCPMCRAPVVVLPPEEEPEPPENDVGGGERSADEMVVHVVEPSRRSVSLGCLEEKELEIISKLRGNNSLGKKLQRMRSGNFSSSSSSSSSPFPMKRSSSCNGKFFMCRPIRVTESILPLRSV